MDHMDAGGAPASPALAEEDAGLIAVEVVGPLSRARFPEVCVSCGEHPERTLPVRKVFWSSGGDDRPSYHFTDGVEAPFCRGCIQQHRSEQRPIPREVRARLLRSWLVQSLPFIVPLGVNLWLVAILTPNLLEAVAAGGDPWEVGIWTAVCGFFGVMAVVFFSMIWKRGRRLTLVPADGSPHYAQVEPGPLGSRFIVSAEPTSVFRALDFTDDRSKLFEPERHRFTFRNHGVAARFSELNADREWDPASRRAQLAAQARWALAAVVFLGALYLLLEDVLR